MLTCGLRPGMPLWLPDYYLRLTVGPRIRQNREALTGFGSYWHSVRPYLSAMTDKQRLDLKLVLMEGWIRNATPSNHAKTVRTVP